MKTRPILIKEFYHDGRGPELQRVCWKYEGKVLAGFEYYNPDDVYDDDHLKHLILKKVQVFAMAGDEVHGNILATGETKAAIFRVINSEWKKTFLKSHIQDCEHYQIMFYDEIYDVICEAIFAGNGPFPE
jgi:hypothetical protein